VEEVTNKDDVKEKKEKKTTKKEKKEDVKDKDVAAVVEKSSGPLSFADIARRAAAEVANAAPEQQNGGSKGFKVMRSAASPTESATAAAPASPTVATTPAVEEAPATETVPAQSTGTTKKVDKEYKKREEFAAFIASVPKGISFDFMIKAFTQFGTVLFVDLPKDKEYGFVKFDSAESLQKALTAGTVTHEGQTFVIEKRSVSKKDAGGAVNGYKKNNKVEFDTMKKDKPFFGRNKPVNKAPANPI
jgi:RNA recognition motif-containing protein